MLCVGPFLRCVKSYLDNNKVIFLLDVLFYKSRFYFDGANKTLIYSIKYYLVTRLSYDTRNGVLFPRWISSTIEFGKGFGGQSKQCFH